MFVCVCARGTSDAVCADLAWRKEEEGVSNEEASEEEKANGSAQARRRSKRGTACAGAPRLRSVDTATTAKRRAPPPPIHA